jgi:hypothetical protein
LGACFGASELSNRRKGNSTAYNLSYKYANHDNMIFVRLAGDTMRLVEKRCSIEYERVNFTSLSNIWPVYKIVVLVKHLVLREKFRLGKRARKRESRGGIKPGLLYPKIRKIKFSTNQIQPT